MIQESHLIGCRQKHAYKTLPCSSMPSWATTTHLSQNTSHCWTSSETTRTTSRASNRYLTCPTWTCPPWWYAGYKSGFPIGSSDNKVVLAEKAAGGRFVLFLCFCHLLLICYSVAILGTTDSCCILACAFIEVGNILAYQKSAGTYSRP